MSSKQNLKLHVKVLSKTLEVSCGSGNQRLRWLGSVAISRYDEESFQGWRELGVVKKITNADGTELDLGATVKDVFQDGDELTVYPSSGGEMVVGK